MQEKQLPQQTLTASSPSRNSQTFSIEKCVDIVDALMVERIGPQSVRRTGIFNLPLRASTQR